MAAREEDVLRVEAAEASLSVKDRMNGYANDTFRIMHQYSGGTKKYYSPDSGDREQTGRIMITKTTEQNRVRYDENKYFSTTVNSDARASFRVTDSAGGGSFYFSNYAPDGMLDSTTDGFCTVGQEAATTDAALTVLKVSARTTGTAETGFGAGMLFTAESGAGSYNQTNALGRIDFSLTAIDEADKESSKMQLQVLDDDVLTTMLSADGRYSGDNSPRVMAHQNFYCMNTDTTDGAIKDVLTLNRDGGGAYVNYDGVAIKAEMADGVGDGALQTLGRMAFWWHDASSKNAAFKIGALAGEEGIRYFLNAYEGPAGSDVYIGTQGVTSLCVYNGGKKVQIQGNQSETITETGNLNISNSRVSVTPGANGTYTLTLAGSPIPGTIAIIYHKADGTYNMTCNITDGTNTVALGVGQICLAVYESDGWALCNGAFS